MGLITKNISECKTMQATIHSNHYLTEQIAIANLRRMGCRKSLAEDETLRPHFDVGEPIKRAGLDTVLNKFGQYCYIKNLIAIV